MNLLQVVKGLSQTIHGVVRPLLTEHQARIKANSSAIEQNSTDLTVTFELFEMQEHIMLRAHMDKIFDLDPEDAVTAYYELREEYLAAMSVANFLSELGSRE